MSIESTSVESIMTRSVVTAKENLSVKSVAKIMVEKGIGSVVIAKNDQDNKPVGMITERDIVREVASDKVSALARDVMSKPVVTIEPRSSLKDAIQTMHTKNIRRLPVVEKGQMVGIITDKDIFRAITKSQSLVASFLSESLVVEYRPMYERFNEFMQGEMLLPDRSQ